MKVTEIIKKLRLDDSTKCLIVNAPDEYKKILGNLKYETKYDRKEQYDFVQLFAITQAELEKLVKQLAGADKYDCLFWACYPKGTGKIKSDIKRETVWDALELAGLRPVSQIAIDDTWSALRGRPPEVVGNKK
ncbi:MAG TPA: hypothetical protein VFW11_12020 [Cyclobacteriaceae bacterium]|nr:hypothetical protein [Cyclobacteriaceae bacterium]